MNISRLLNPDTDTCPPVHHEAEDPDIISGATKSPRVVRPRSKFIDLVTGSHVDANSMNSQGHHMTALDEAHSGVNDRDNSSERQKLPDSKKRTARDSSSHHHDHRKLTRYTAGTDSSNEEQSDDDYASEDSEKVRPGTKPNYKSWNDVPVEFRCTFVEGCVLDSPDRKVISHFFGRNKKCTRAIPEDVWAPFCRRHYQRTRYRNVDNFGGVQLDLVRRTVENLQNWGGVSHFELILRKRAMQAIKRDERHTREEKSSHPSTMRVRPNQEKSPGAETWLLPYLGKRKSFEEILQFVDLIEERVTENNSKLPEFEILPCYKPGRMNIPTSKKTLKGTAKPAGIRKRQIGRTASASRSAAQSKSVATTPATTPMTTPSLTPKTLETRSGRGDVVRARPPRTPVIFLPHSSRRPTRRHSTP
ncbi:hypothetical protein MMC26_004360 [Xylographa opegraphella]|nr:hypothetical protein [Xylographa opegraphella]